jgi:hypothetical protein
MTRPNAFAPDPEFKYDPTDPEGRAAQAAPRVFAV